MALTDPTDSVPPGPVPLWSRLIATFFGIGYCKPGPGTWAATATMLLWLWLGRFVPVYQHLNLMSLAAVIVTLVGIPAATSFAKAIGRKDPSQVVLDEVAGQMIAMVGAPLHWQSLLVSLILFRVFDITKPPPVRELEKLPGGVGIMLDDVGAGIYALMLMQILLRIGLL